MNGGMGGLAQQTGKSAVWSLESASSLGLGGLALPKLEPAGEDVTMATKEAFAAVNSMFGGVMPCYGSGVVRVSRLLQPQTTCVHVQCCPGELGCLFQYNQNSAGNQDLGWTEHHSSTWLMLLGFSVFMGVFLTC